MVEGLLPVLVFGVGDVWERLIKPALLELAEEYGLELRLHLVGRKKRDFQDPTIQYYQFYNPGDMAALWKALRQGLFQVAIIGSSHEAHSDLLLPLLDRVPVIICEKPVDTDLDRAKRVEAWIEAIEALDGKRHVFITAHYCWKPAIQYLLKNWNSLLERIGEVREVFFSLREPEGIEKGREDTLREGLILDLAIHGFAILIELFGASAIEVDEQNVRAAQYQGAPAPLVAHLAETAAVIPLTLDGIPGQILIGKACGFTDKSLRLRGSEAELFVDIAAGKLHYYPGEDEQPKIIRADGPPPYVALLEAAILRGEGIPYRRGVEALELALQAKRAIHRVENYPLGTWPFEKAAVRA